MDFSIRRPYQMAQATLVDGVDRRISPRSSPAKTTTTLWHLNSHGVPTVLNEPTPGTSFATNLQGWTSPPPLPLVGSPDDALLSPLMITPSPRPAVRTAHGKRSIAELQPLQPQSTHREPVSVTNQSHATNSDGHPASKRRLMDVNTVPLNSGNDRNDDCYTENGERITLRLLYDMLKTIHTSQTSNVCGQCKRPVREPEPVILPGNGERAAVRAAYASGLKRSLKWVVTDGHSLEHPDNDAMNAHIRTAVQATHPTINPQALQKAMQSHFDTHSTRAKKEAKGTARASGIKSKRTMRKHTKSKRRVTALLGKKSYSDADKKKYTAAMQCIDLMSSDDSDKEDESGKDIFVPRPFVWLSAEAKRVKAELDTKAGRRESQKAANMRHERRVGPACTRPPTKTVRQEFAWAIAPEYK